MHITGLFPEPPEVRSQDCNQLLSTYSAKCVWLVQLLLYWHATHLSLYTGNPVHTVLALDKVWGCHSWPHPRYHQCRWFLQTCLAARGSGVDTKIRMWTRHSLVNQSTKICVGGSQLNIRNNCLMIESCLQGCLIRGHMSMPRGAQTKVARSSARILNRDAKGWAKHFLKVPLHLFLCSPSYKCLSFQVHGFPPLDSLP